MRIAVLTRHFSRLAGGAESYAVAIVAELSTRHELHVYTQQSDEPVAGVHYHYLPGWGKRLRWLNQLVFAICSWWMTRRGFDVVHAHENTWHGQVQTIHVRPMKLSFLFDTKDWRSLRSRLSLFMSVRLQTHLALEKARFKPQLGRLIVATSEALRTDCARAYPAAQAGMRVAPPGTLLPPRAQALREAPSEVEQSLRARWDIEGVRYVGLFVANDYRRKGLDALLRALQQSNDVGLVVVGSSGPIGTYAAIAKSLGLASRVRFVGPQTDTGQFYLAADFLVHPTLEDAYAMVVLEAMAHGLPVIVSGAQYCGISRDLSADGNALILMDPLDPQAISNAMGRLMHDRSLYDRIRHAGRSFAEARGWESVALQYEALYQQAQAASASR